MRPLKNSVLSNAKANFNPRTREGCDMIILTKWLKTKNFNPRTREGCDPKVVVDYYKEQAFQSTHPRGVRRKYLLCCIRGSDDFNPRTREGCDMKINCLIFLQRIFQSTHPRGVRRSIHDERNKRSFISIHAPARGATWYRHCIGQ